MYCSFKKLIVCLILAGLSLAGYPEEFHLKNGQVIKARLIREDENYYYIQLSFGMTTLAKTQVTGMVQEQKKISPRQEFETLCKNSASEKDCIEASDYAVKNNLFVPALLFLKNSLNRWNPDSKTLNEKIASIEKAYAGNVTDKIKKFYEDGHFRKAALAYEEAVTVYPALEEFKNLQEYKNKFSASLMTEEDSLEKIRFYIRLFPDYSTEASPASPASNDLADKNPFALFAAEEKTFHPRFSSLLLGIEALLQHHDYIQKYKTNEEVLKPLHSRKELDVSRADTRKFNLLCTENNRIYKAKAVLRDYAQKLSYLKTESQAMIKQLENEALEWKARGYEKINGRWLKGDELKKAKGMELYKGEWLDPRAPDYAARKAGLDKPFLPLGAESEEKTGAVSGEARVGSGAPSDSNPKNLESPEEIIPFPIAVILLSILGAIWWFTRKKR